jgi:uncharacterized protein YkwD
MFRLLLVLAFGLAGGTQDRPQPQIDLVDLERRILELINAERAGFKLRPLKTDERLSDIARLHSEDMDRRNFFDHVNPDGKDPTGRGRERRYTCRKDFGQYYAEGLAENIFQNNLYNRVFVRGSEMTFDWNTAEEIALTTVDGWMRSAGHRRTILTPRYDKTGIGIFIASNDQVLITQLFC